MSEQQPAEKKMTAGTAVSRMKKRYLKWTGYGIVILVITIIQSLPRGLPAVAGAHPTIIIPVVICVAMFEGPVGGAAAGVAGGVLWDMFTVRPMGFNALVLMILCCASGLLSQLLIRNNLISSMLMTAAALVIQHLLDWFFNDILAFRPDIFGYFIRHGVSALYALALSPLFYLLVAAVARLLNRRE